MLGKACQEGYAIHVARKKMFREEKYVRTGISYVQIVSIVDFLDRLGQHAHYVESL
jgi:hypothetical protein